ncbi:MAG: hypothetical protein H7X71_06510 [Chitinophagales bacterium]|nr:hypothetical protein [Chitinophagales bacterium]
MLHDNNLAYVFTDGSCHPQFRIGAWGAIILIGEKKLILTGEESDTTNNRMELLAVIKAIEEVRNKFKTITDIRIITDSQYVAGLVARQEKFIQKNFKTAVGNVIRNADLVKTLLYMHQTDAVHFEKIKAHQKKSDTVNYNREIDKLCRKIVREAVKKLVS